MRKHSCITYYIFRWFYRNGFFYKLFTTIKDKEETLLKVHLRLYYDAKNPNRQRSTWLKYLSRNDLHMFSELKRVNDVASSLSRLKIIIAFEVRERNP